MDTSTPKSSIPLHCKMQSSLQRLESRLEDIDVQLAAIVGYMTLKRPEKITKATEKIQAFLEDAKKETKTLHEIKRTISKQIKDLEDKNKIIQSSLDETLKTFMTEASSPLSFLGAESTAETSISTSTSTSFSELLPNITDSVEKNIHE